MAGNRVLDPPRNLDPELRLRSQLADLQARIALLERDNSTRTYAFSTPVGSLSLGSFDGENISGIRISGSLITSATGGNTVVRLRPNGLSSIVVQHLYRRTFWDATSETSDHVYGANGASGLGLIVAAQDWGVSINSLQFDGIFYTNNLVSGAYRHWLGSYSNKDHTTNNDRWLTGAGASVWKDSSTVVNSMTIAIDSGAFRGRVSAEIIP